MIFMSFVVVKQTSAIVNLVIIVETQNNNDDNNNENRNFPDDTKNEFVWDKPLLTTPPY